MSNRSPQSKQSCLTGELVADAEETNLEAVEAISWRIPLDMEEEEEEEEGAKEERCKEECFEDEAEEEGWRRC